MTTIYLGGSFDLWHKGHVNLLQTAAGIAGQGGRVVVAVNSDAFHKAYRGVDPIIGEWDRLKVVLACRYVTHAFLMPDHSTQRSTIALWKPDYIMHGDDWTGESLLKQLGIDGAFLDAHGIKMYYAPYTEGVSSRVIRGKL